MLMWALEAFRCPLDGVALRVKQASQWDREDLLEGELVCAEGHVWKVSKGLPSLVRMEEVSKEDMRWIREYDARAEEYDERIKIYDIFLKTNMMEGRQEFMATVPLEEGSRIADVSIGTALNFVAMHNADPEKTRQAFLYGMDLSLGMLRVARRKLTALNLRSALVHADTNRRYPFPHDYFDAVLHTGGINTFSDQTRAFAEMTRICKPGGMVVACDEGLSPEQEKTEFGQWIISHNKLFKHKPPLDKVPKDVEDLKHWWVMNETFYVITYRKPS